MIFYNEKRIPIDSNYRKYGQYPYYGATGIIDYVDDYIFDGEYVLLAEDGANILTRNSPIAYLTKGRFWLNNHAHIMKTKNGSNLFLIELLERQNFAKYNSGTAQPKLNSKVVKNIILRFPQSDEQKIIGELLKNLNLNITLHQRKINILKRVKQQYLRVMFVRKGENTPDIRFNGFKDIWKQSALNSIYKVTMGHSPKSENYTSNPDDYILVQGNADILNGWVFPRVWTTQITNSIQAGSILLSVRAPVGNVGKTAYDVVIGRGIAAIEGEEFLYQLLNKMHLEGYWRRISTGSTFESINSKDIKEALIKLPIEEERKSIGEFLQELDSHIILHQSKLSILEQLKQSYLRKMFL